MGKNCLNIHEQVRPVADLGGGQGALAGGGGGIFWPVGQKFWARGEMKTYMKMKSATEFASHN